MSNSTTHNRVPSNTTADTVDYFNIDRYGFFADGSSNQVEEVIDIEKLHSREKKWLEMTKNWDYWMTEKFAKVRSRCRKGIPTSVRSVVWLKLVGADKKIQESPGLYKRYLESEADPKCISDIARDVGRQFPEHVLFHTSNPEETHLKFSMLESSPSKRSAAGNISNVISPPGDQDGSKGHIGQYELYRVLKAYSVHNRRDGYCQAQAPIAAALIMELPDEEQAFWVMERIFDVYLAGYYKDGLEQMQIDGEILMELLKMEHPRIHKLLTQQKIEPPLFMTDWFMCCFIRSLPWASVLRVLDMFLCEGVKVLFRVALAIISNTLNPKTMKSCSSQFETLPLLRRPPKEILAPEFLVRECLKAKITERDIAAAHLQVLRRWRDNVRFRSQQQQHQQQQRQQVQQPSQTKPPQVNVLEHRV